jgi:proteasome lid subunit RPN8/RPN11
MLPLPKVYFCEPVLSDVIEIIRSRLPVRTSGLFISTNEFGPADGFHIFGSNIRNSDGWREQFRSYGGHQLTNDDVGFVVHPAEVATVHLRLRKEKKHAVGLFHTHRLLGPEFTQIDLDMHVDETLWHLIVSVVDPQNPQLKGYCIRSRSVHPVEIEIIKDKNAPHKVMGPAGVSDQNLKNIL